MMKSIILSSQTPYAACKTQKHQILYKVASIISASSQWKLRQKHVDKCRRVSNPSEQPIISIDALKNIHLFKKKSVHSFYYIFHKRSYSCIVY